jgi:hypothetical protein
VVVVVRLVIWYCVAAKTRRQEKEKNSNASESLKVVAV